MESRTSCRLSIAVVLGLACATAGAVHLRTERVWFGGDGDWDNPDNWDPPGIPGTDVVDRATIAGGSVTLGSPYTIADLSVDAAELDASSDLLVSGTARVAGGMITGSGDLTVDAMVLDGGVVTEKIDDCCNVVVTGSLELRGAGTNQVGRALANEGAGSWLGADLDLAGGVLRNVAGATLVVETTADVEVAGGAVENLGTWIYQAQDCCEFRIASDFRNTGTVDLRSGVVEVQDCCEFRQGATGVAHLAAGATLRFVGGAHELGGSVAGEGEVDVSAGAVTVPAGSSYGPARTAVTGGTLILEAGSSPGLSTVDLAGGTVITRGDLSVDEGRITAGIAKVDDCCEMVFTDALELAGPDPKGVEGAVVSRGAGAWTGGELDLSAGRLVNDAGGTFIVGSDADLEVRGSGESTGARVENAGEWIVQIDDCCELRGDFDLENRGRVAVEGGAMRLGLTCVSPGEPEEDCWNLTQTSEDARTEVAAGATLAADVMLAGGVLEGEGRVEGRVVNGSSPTGAARVRPGPVAGSPPAEFLLTLNGDYVQTADGTLAIDLVDVGASPVHSVLAVTGSASLDGTLALSPDPDFDPAAGDAFEVLTWGSRDGEFSGITGADLAGPLILDAAYENGGLVLHVDATEGPELTAAIGANGPAAGSSATPGTGDVPMLQTSLDVAAGGDHALLRSVTLRASGSGDDRADLTAVAIHDDENGNGRLDTGEQTLAAGSYARDDGDLTLTLIAPLRIGSGSEANLLLTYDLAASAASASPGPHPVPRGLPGLPAPWVLLLPLGLALACLARVASGWGRRCAALVTVLIISGGVSCSGDSTGPQAEPATYAVELVSMEVDGETSGKAATVTGLPVRGTVLTVTR